MNPEEKALLKKTLELSEENNHILKKMHRAARLAFVWGFIKILIVVIPLVIGYLYLLPRIEIWRGEIEQVKSVIPALNSLSQYLPR